MKKELREALKTVTEAVTELPNGGRHIVVLDRGWIFEGILKEPSPGKYRLTDAYNIRKWNKNGFGGLTESAKASEAVLDKARPIEFDASAMIFSVPTSEDWRE